MLIPSLELSIPSLLSVLKYPTHIVEEVIIIIVVSSNEYYWFLYVYVFYKQCGSCNYSDDHFTNLVLFLHC